VVPDTTLEEDCMTQPGHAAGDVFFSPVRRLLLDHPMPPCNTIDGTSYENIM
jgi:hypothetical protein